MQKLAASKRHDTKRDNVVLAAIKGFWEQLYLWHEEDGMWGLLHPALEL